MLVLSRKKNEMVTVVTPDKQEIQFTVVEIRGDKVRVGIVVPKDYAVYRQEVLDVQRTSQAQPPLIEPS